MNCGQSYSMVVSNQITINNSVGPLFRTTCNQSPYYNAQRPGGSVTGCVSTAMAQVMKYWIHPSQGTGMHSNNHDTYDTLSTNFGATPYQWSSMPNSISGPNDAIATLIYHYGVSVDMDYSPERVEHGLLKATNLFVPKALSKINLVIAVNYTAKNRIIIQQAPTDKCT